MILVLGLSDKYNHYAVKPQPGYRGEFYISIALSETRVLFQSEAEDL